MRNENKFYATVANNLFSGSILSEDLINLYYKYNDNALGMVGYDVNGQMVEIDDNLLYEIKEYVANHPKQEVYNATSPEMSLTTRGLCAKYGTDAIGMPSQDINGKPIIISKALYQTFIQTTKELYEKSAPIRRYDPRIDRSAPDFVRPQGRETRMHKHNKVSIKWAEESFDSLSIPKSEVDEESREEYVKTPAECLHAFAADPMKDTYMELVCAVKKEFNRDMDKEEHKVDAKLLQLARNEGISWINENTLPLLVEIFHK